MVDSSILGVGADAALVLSLVPGETDVGGCSHPSGALEAG